MTTKIQKELETVLLSFGEKYYIDDKLNKTKLIEDIDNYNEDLIVSLLQNKIIKKHYAKEISGYIILEINKLIETLEMNDYWMDSYTKYSKKIGLTTNDKFIDENTDVVLDFPYKDTVLKAGMMIEDDGKNEPFFNEVIAAYEIDTLLDKKIMVNAKRYTPTSVKSENIISEQDNLILKGNNLLGLHTLKFKYANKVKMIFIDPPYYFYAKKPNDSFSYNTNFKLSSWLTFMKNRLEISRDLLNEFGVIYITISDEGAHYLKVLCDDIFGVENFIADVTWESRTSISSDGLISMNSNPY